MTDPVERVARRWHESFGSVGRLSWSQLNEAQIDQIRLDVGRFFAVLAEEGIPVAQLLSGEMVATEVNWLERQHMNDEWREWHGLPVSVRGQAKTQ